MDEKTLSFNIDILGVSNEASELAKITLQLQAIKKERAELIKQASAPGHIASTEERLKLAAYNKEISIQEASLKTLKRVVDTANDSLARKKALLIELTEKSNKASAAVATGMAPAIKKLNDEIKAGEEARGVFTRNVGNYPQLAQAAGQGMNQLGGAIGGVTGELSNAVSGFLMASGPTGILTAGISALALAWKRTQENIDLYLSSADKVRFGFAGYSRDAEEARVDVRRRAEGQTAEGVRNLRSANYMLTRATTDEEREKLKIMAQEALLMINEGNALKDQVTGLQSRITWRLKYNELLQEEENLADEKLAKETEWEALEANLTKQRAIVSDQESTAAQKKQAAIDADVIASKLAGEKIILLNKQIDNTVALSEMTATQEVVEDKINAMLKERNTIQKEYYADQVKINRLENSANRSSRGGSASVSEGDLLLNKGADLLKYVAPSGGDIPAEIAREQFIQDEKERLWQEGMAKAREVHEQNKQNAIDYNNELINIELDKLDMKQEIADAEIAIAAGIGGTLKLLSGKNKTLALTALAIEKAAAIGQIISNVSIANAKAMATSPLTLGQPWVTLNTGLGAVSIAGLVAEAARSSGEISKYETGGKATKGIPVYTGTKDNLLVAVNNTETILTDRHVAMLGGSGVMKRIGVPGYASGGYAGQQAPIIPSAGPDFDSMVKAIRDIQIHLDIHKVRSALNETDVILESQKI